MGTYTVAQAVRHARARIKNIPVSDIELIDADEVNSTIWRAYPWRWSLVAMTPIALTDGVQDYTFAPTNYFRLLRARIVRTDSTPDEYGDPLDIVNHLEADLQSQAYPSIRSVSYEGELGKLRLERAVSVPTNVTLQLQGEYQRQPTKITTVNDLWPFPDQYLNVAVAGLKWKFGEFAEDFRSGNSQKSSQGVSAWSGFQAAFYDAIEDMAAAEGFGAGDIIAPSEALFAE